MDHGSTLTDTLIHVLPVAHLSLAAVGQLCLHHTVTQMIKLDCGA